MTPKCVNTVVCGTFGIALFVQAATENLSWIFVHLLRVIKTHVALKPCASPLYCTLGTSSELELVPRTTLRFYKLGKIPLLLSQQYFLSFMYPWSPTGADRFTFMHLTVVFIQSSRLCIQGKHFIISCIPWKSNQWLWHCYIACSIVWILECIRVTFKIYERLLSLGMYWYTFRNAFHIHL